jgi:hypothetical protein
MTEHHLYPEPPLFAAAARRTDPPTSHAAAARKELFAGTHRWYVYEALKLGPAGQTEIARRITAVSMTPHAANKRAGELLRLGYLIEDGKDNGGKERRYRISPASR